MINKTFLLVLSLIFWGGKLCAQTNITVATFDGGEYVNELSTGTRITFVNDSIVIGSGIGCDTSMMFSLAHVSKLYFSENVVTNVRIVEDCRIVIFPNPVYNHLTIKGIQGENSLSIYSINGTGMLCKQYKRGEYVDVSWLKPGNYIIRVGKCVGKFTKR